MRVALDMVRSAAMAGLLALEIGRRRGALARTVAGPDAGGAPRHLRLPARRSSLHGGIGMTLEYAVGIACGASGAGPAVRRRTGHAARLGAALATDRLAA
jgi:hypothetical protein